MEYSVDEHSHCHSAEFVSTDRDELQDFTRPPSIDRAISAMPDFARSVDEDEPDSVEWHDNTVYETSEETCFLAIREFCWSFRFSSLCAEAHVDLRMLRSRLMKR